MKQLCYHCMQYFEGGSVCPHCGHDLFEEYEHVPYHLKRGTLLANRYIIGAVLGEGGFGITYIGLDKTLVKRIAVKEFFPAGAANRNSDSSDKVFVSQSKEEFFKKGINRFLREAQSVAAFSDEDGIVDVLDYFQANATAYIVMEYLEGETLQAHIDRGELFRANTLITLMKPVMKSLNAMHAKGIIHRDISPDNIMYTQNGALKVMDFGSARYYTNHARQMSVVLKQGYAPEEQYRRNGVQGPFTDVYALCATIYSCITGRVPEDSLDRLVNDTLIPPSKLGVAISPTQEAALMHGLALQASERTPNMNALNNEFSADRRVTMDANQYYQDYYNRQPGPPRAESYPKPAPPPHNRTQEPYADSYRQPPKKSNAPLIVALVITITAIVAIGIILAVMLLGGNRQPTDLPSTAAYTTQATTEAEETTEEETEEETTEETEPTTEETTAPPTEAPSTEPTTQGRSLTHEEINEITNQIQEYFTKFMNSDYRTGQVKVGDYAYYILPENGHLWIATPNNTMRDENEGGAYQVKTWYFYDAYGSVYFVFRYDGTEFYRYYIDNDEIVRYTVGSHYSGNQVSYDYGDSHIPDSASIISEAYGAYNYILS